MKISKLLLLMLLPLNLQAEVLPVPQLISGESHGKTIIKTWAHAGKSVRLQVKALKPGTLKMTLYQVSGNTMIPLVYEIDPPELVAGNNDLKLRIPANSQRGTVLYRLANSEGKLLGNLMVDILPADSWASMIKYSQNDAVMIDPTLKKLSTWAQAQGIKVSAQLSKDIQYTFAKTKPLTTGPVITGVLVYERKNPDPLPVIEVINDADLKTITLPPGYLDALPESAPAQALLLKQLKLLP